MKYKYFKNVATLNLYKDKCVGCGMCLKVCPHGVFNIKQGKAEIVNKDSCMECGACLKNCAFNAIEVKSGVGCAQAIIFSKITGGEPNCDCSNDGNRCC